MTDYSNWKVKKSIFNYVGDDEEKQEQANIARQEYADAAEWCNESGQYHIEETRYYYEVMQNPAPTPPSDEEIKEMRARAYAEEVDCITAHIQRLRDTDPMTQEVEEEINELIAERAAKVEEIKQRYPYNEESDENI